MVIKAQVLAGGRGKGQFDNGLKVYSERQSRSNVQGRSSFDLLVYRGTHVCGKDARSYTGH